MLNAIHGQMPIATKEEEQKLLMCKIPKENWSMQWHNKQCKAIRKSSLCISIKSAQSNNNCFLPHQRSTCRASLYRMHWMFSILFTIWSFFIRPQLTHTLTQCTPHTSKYSVRSIQAHNLSTLFDRSALKCWRCLIYDLNHSRIIWNDLRWLTFYVRDGSVYCVIFTWLLLLPLCYCYFHFSHSLRPNENLIFNEFLSGEITTSSHIRFGWGLGNGNKHTASLS